MAYVKGNMIIFLLIWFWSCGTRRGECLVQESQFDLGVSGVLGDEGDTKERFPPLQNIRRVEE